MKQKDILIILTLLFVFVVAWIGSSIYHSIVNSTISEAINQDIAPIKPSFDTQTLNMLKRRPKINPTFELGIITPTPTPILPTEIISPEPASPEGKLEP
ncbi:MAG: hypothetical protein HY424_01550 [Candidatus Levybacteria bacterium]|nr:hypothetical protein [Candidatus Levybacteria bacterium]